MMETMYEVIIQKRWRVRLKASNEKDAKQRAEELVADGAALDPAAEIPLLEAVEVTARPTK